MDVLYFNATPMTKMTGKASVATISGTSTRMTRETCGLEHGFVNYDARDGLQGDEFNQAAYLKGKNGNIYFGGVMGLTIFNPDNLIENEFIPPVYLTDFQLFHEPISISKSGILTQSIETTQSITLNYREATFGMVFSALNYRQSNKNRFAYILEGIDKEWIETDHEMRMASYTKVDPGTYTFRVKASNDDIKWNNEGASLEIKRLGPWWARWWVRAIAIVLFICILWAIHQASVHFLRKQKVSLEKRVRERTNRSPFSFLLSPRGHRFFQEDKRQIRP